jgi:hypothetical protein
MPTLRTVVGELLGPDGAPLRNARVSIQFTGSFTPTSQMVARTIEAATNAAGRLCRLPVVDGVLTEGQPHWANEEGDIASQYILRAPGVGFAYSIPASGPTEVELSILREAGVTPMDPQYPSVLAYVDANAIAPAVAAAAAATAAAAAAPTWKGTWTFGGVYTVGNMVARNGSTYTARVGNTGLPPESNPTQWALAASKGDPGTAATIAVGSVTTGAPGSSASVTNSGTAAAAVFDITIPRGNTGASGVDAPLAATVTDIAGTTYTLGLGDLDGFLRFTNAGAVALTIPPNSSVAWPIGRAVGGVQSGAGQVTIAPGSGVTLNSVGTKSRVQNSAWTLLKTGTDRWLLMGDVI